MSEADIKRIVSQYEALLTKAKTFLDEGPRHRYRTSFYHDDHLRLSIEEDHAVITDFTTDSEGCVDFDRCKFPLYLLALEESELSQWARADASRIEKGKAAVEQERARRDAAANEARERQLYEMLKAKFEPKQ